MAGLKGRRRWREREREGKGKVESGEKCETYVLATTTSGPMHKPIGGEQGHEVSARMRGSEC